MRPFAVSTAATCYYNHVSKCDVIKFATRVTCGGWDTLCTSGIVVDVMLASPKSARQTRRKYDVY